MLQIRQLRTYDIAKYPQGSYRPKPSPQAMAYAKGGIASVSLIVLFESCRPLMMSGVPIVRQVTEQMAWQVISNTFNQNGIVLTPDANIEFRNAKDERIMFKIDGYNDSLRIGYEYISSPEDSAAKVDKLQALESLNPENGPHVKTIGEITYIFDERWDAALSQKVQNFIDSLKTHGAI